MPLLRRGHGKRSSTTSWIISSSGWNRTCHPVSTNRSAGLVAYRDGDYTRAIEELTRCNDGMAQHEQPERTAAAQILLAMSHHRMGRSADSARWRNEAATTMQPVLATRTWLDVSDDGLRYLILRQEAEELIQGTSRTAASVPVSGGSQQRGTRL